VVSSSKAARGEAAGERDGGGGAEQAEIDAVDAEAGGFAGHDQVAGAGKLAACGGGDALDLGDDGLGQGGDRLHHAGAAVEEGLESGALPPSGAVRKPLHLFQVVAGGEGLALGGEDHHADAVVGGEAVKLSSKRGEHRGGKRVQRAGRGEGDGGDPVLDVASDQRIGHCIPQGLRPV
jgi:hypothetical protein